MWHNLKISITVLSKFYSIDPAATKECIGNMVSAMKTFYNSFWTILSRTTTQEKQDEILDIFYRRFRDLIAIDPLWYNLDERITVLQIAKL